MDHKLALRPKEALVGFWIFIRESIDLYSCIRHWLLQWNFRVVDPTEFFSKTFGGERFADLIGEISIARAFTEAINEEEDDSEGPQDEEKKRKKAEQAQVQAEEQAKVRTVRVEKLVANLIKRLDIYVEEPDSQKAFEEIARLEAEELKNESYGMELLHAIGYTYSLKARQYLGKDVIFGFPKFFQQVREKGHIISETVGTIRSAMDLHSSYNQLQEAEKSGNLDASGKAKLEELTAQKVGIPYSRLSLAWVSYILFGPFLSPERSQLIFLLYFLGIISNMADVKIGGRIGA